MIRARATYSYRPRVQAVNSLKLVTRVVLMSDIPHSTEFSNVVIVGKIGSEPHLEYVFSWQFE